MKEIINKFKILQKSNNIFCIAEINDSFNVFRI